MQTPKNISMTFASKRNGLMDDRITVMTVVQQITEKTIMHPAIPTTFASRNVKRETGFESRSSRVPFFISRWTQVLVQITAATNPRNSTAAILLSRMVQICRSNEKKVNSGNESTNRRVLARIRKKTGSRRHSRNVFRVRERKTDPGATGLVQDQFASASITSDFS